MEQRMRVLTAAAALILSLGCGRAAQSVNLITVEPNGFQTAQQRAKVWEEIDAEKREKIESFLMRQLGLSSTAYTQLLGVYHQENQGEDPDNMRLLLHIQQLDLMGTRLFWSVLVDPVAMSVRVLYHPDASRVSSTFVPISE